MSQSAVLAFEPLLASEQAASLLGIHPNTLLLWARQGRVPCIRIGNRRVMFRASALNLWLEGPSYTDRAILTASTERKAA